LSRLALSVRNILFSEVPSLSHPDKRQSGIPGNPLNIISSFRKVAAKAPSKPVLEETLKAQKFSGAKRKQVVWGPYSIRAVKVRHTRVNDGVTDMMNRKSTRKEKAASNSTRTAI
jgi:hypothetical protein